MSDTAASDPYVTLTVAPDTGLGLILDAMEAVEELGRPFTIVLDVSSEKAKGDLHTLLGASATVKLVYPKKATRYFNGVVSRFVYRGLSGGGYKYRIELRPWIWLLSHEQDCRIFQSKSAWTIITGIFRDAGFTDFQDKRQNASGDLSLDYCVQYRESTLDFVTRLMEQFGIYYYVEHSDGSHKVVFADDPNSHTAASKPIPYEYNQTEWRVSEDHVWDWNAEAQIQPGAFTLREYNFTTPKADLTAKSIGAGGHTYGSNEVYDYPGLYDTANDGQSAAKVRMQDFATRRQMYGGTSNSRALGCGTKFTLSNFPDTAANQEYLVTESICTVERRETRAFQGNGDENIDTFRCVMRAAPGTRPFRLPVTTRRPLIQGPQTAKVVGEQGQEITTDQYGRIKVKFPWDRSAGEDQNSSCWIRVAQVWAGKSWGGMVIPRIGQEVIVEFLEGNPDRPLVTGTVYNADQTVPYALPANKTRSTFKSNSSLNGGGFNEFRFEDKKGSEEIYMHAQFDYNEVIGNNHTETIKQDTTTEVTSGNRSYTIKAGTDYLKVEGDRTVELNSNDSLTVASNRTTTIKGNHTAKVTGTEDIKVTGNRTSVYDGTDSETVTGKRTDTFDAGHAQTVKSGQTVTVQSGNHELSVSAGTSTISSPQKITLKVGPSSIELTPAGITIKAPKISIDGGTELEMTALQSSLEGTVKVEVSGLAAEVSGSLSLALKGGAEATLKGGVVMIN